MIANSACTSKEQIYIYYSYASMLNGGLDYSPGKITPYLLFYKTSVLFCSIYQNMWAN